MFNNISGVNTVIEQPEKLTMIPTYNCSVFSMLLYILEWRNVFTQFTDFSLFSPSLLCSSSPTPPGAPNCFTARWVLVNWSSVSRCFMHFRYVSSVSLRGGSGNLGRPWSEWETCPINNKTQINSFSQSEVMYSHFSFKK